MSGSGQPCIFVKEISSSKSSSQLSVCISGGWSTNASGSRIFSTRLMPEALPLGTEPIFQADEPDEEDCEPVDVDVESNNGPEK